MNKQYTNKNKTIETPKIRNKKEKYLPKQTKRNKLELRHVEYIIDLINYIQITHFRTGVITSRLCVFVFPWGHSYLKKYVLNSCLHSFFLCFSNSFFICLPYNFLEILTAFFSLFPCFSFLSLARIIFNLVMIIRIIFL